MTGWPDPPADANQTTAPDYRGDRDCRAAAGLQADAVKRLSQLEWRSIGPADTVWVGTGEAICATAYPPAPGCILPTTAVKPGSTAASMRP